MRMHLRLRGLLAITSLIILAACVHHTFAPGPGMSAMDFEPDSARCRIFARNDNPGFEFGASGSPRFVATSMAAAAIAGVVGTAIRENGNYNDCMEAHGWRVADGSPQAGGMAVPASNSLPGAAPEQPMQASGSIPRREFGVRADVVTDTVAADLHLSPPQGVVILAVEAGGAASSAGLLGGDVILSFGGAPIMTIADVQRALDTVMPNNLVTATIWRNGHERPIQIQF